MTKHPTASPGLSYSYSYSYSYSTSETGFLTHHSPLHSVH